MRGTSPSCCHYSHSKGMKPYTITQSWSGHEGPSSPTPTGGLRGPTCRMGTQQGAHKRWGKGPCPPARPFPQTTAPAEQQRWSPRSEAQAKGADQPRPAQRGAGLQGRPPSPTESPHSLPGGPAWPPEEPLKDGYLPLPSLGHDGKGKRRHLPPPPPPPTPPGQGDGTASFRHFTMGRWAGPSLWRGSLRAGRAPLSREADGSARPFAPEEGGRAHSHERGEQPPSPSPRLTCLQPPRHRPRCLPAAAPPRRALPQPGLPCRAPGPACRRHGSHSDGAAAALKPLKKAGAGGWAAAAGDRQRGGQPAGARAALRGGGRAAPQGGGREPP